MLPMLYSKREDGKLQTWTMEVQDNKYRTISGIDGGQAVTSEWTVCQGKNLGAKNETTPQQQAEKEARAHWKKKKDKGYREDPNDTDDVGFFEPMLAYNYDDYKGVLKFPFYTQPKLDGIRCVVSRTGMWSRNGKPLVSAPHILEALQPLLRADPHIVVDGELYADKFAEDFNAICSLAKRSKPTSEDLEFSAMHLEYHVYDMVFTNTPEVRFGMRQRSLNTLISALPPSKVRIVTTQMVTSQAELDELYGKWVDQQYEGQMIRLDEAYEHKRSRFLLKRKEFVSCEFPVVDMREGLGNWSGCIKVLTCQLPDGRTFGATLKTNRATAVAMLKQPCPKEATVKFFAYTPDGIPRFPVAVAWFKDKRDI